MRLLQDAFGTQWYIQCEPDLPLIEAVAVMRAFNCRWSWAPPGHVVLVPADPSTPAPTAVDLAGVYIHGFERRPRGWGSV